MFRFSLLKAIGGPGSLGFLVVGTAMGLILVYVSTRTRRWGRYSLVALFVSYLGLSLPFVAHAIAGLLSGSRPDATPTASQVDELFVLDGDNRKARAVTAGKIFAASEPKIVWILGADELRDAVLASGVPRDRTAWDGTTLSTYDQMVWVQGHLTRPGSGRKALVASRLQMPRIAALARAGAMDLLLIPSPMDDEPRTSGLRLLLPSLAALTVSRDALYEIAALAYYRWRGWI